MASSIYQTAIQRALIGRSATVEAITVDTTISWAAIAANGARFLRLDAAVTVSVPDPVAGDNGKRIIVCTDRDFAVSDSVFGPGVRFTGTAPTGSTGGMMSASLFPLIQGGGIIIIDVENAALVIRRVGGQKEAFFLPATGTATVLSTGTTLVAGGLYDAQTGTSGFVSTLPAVPALFDKITIGHSTGTGTHLIDTGSDTVTFNGGVSPQRYLELAASSSVVLTWDGTRWQRASTVGTVTLRALWTPAAITASTYWLDPDDLTEALGATVQNWASKGSSAAATWSQATTTKRPTIASALQNGHKRLTFDGTDDSMVSTINHLAMENHSIYMMWSPASIVESHDVFGYWENLTGSILVMDLASGIGGVIRSHVQQLANSVTGPAADELSVIGQRFDRTALSVWATHNAVQSTTPGVVSAQYTAGGTKPYGICGDTRSSGVEYSNGTIGDVIISRSDLGDPSAVGSDAARVNGYLMWKYAAQANLGGTHAYRNVPPTI